MNESLLDMMKLYVLTLYVSVCELKNPSMSAFLQGLEGSSWLKHIKAIIDTSVFIAEVGCSSLLSFCLQKPTTVNFIKKFQFVK